MKDRHLQHKQLITPSVSNQWKKWQVGTVQLMQPRSTITVPTLCWDHTMFGEHAPVHCHMCHCRKCKTIPYHQDNVLYYCDCWFPLETEYQWISVNPRRYNIKHHQTSSKHHLSHQAERNFMHISETVTPRCRGSIRRANWWRHQLDTQRKEISSKHCSSEASGFVFVGEKLSPFFFHTMTPICCIYYTLCFLEYL